VKSIAPNASVPSSLKPQAYGSSVVLDADRGCGENADIAMAVGNQDAARGSRIFCKETNDEIRKFMIVIGKCRKKSR
jgi:hypothetical protein